MGVNQASDFHYMMRLSVFLYSAMIYCLVMAQTYVYTLLDTIFVGEIPDGIEKLQ
jgi:hypothetical protein